MENSMMMISLVLPIFAALFFGFLYLLFLVTKALGKYMNTQEVRDEKKMTKKSLGEALKEHRTTNKMTQEFVAEAIGVSRQAVSKWENGTADPSTSNLVALAKLFRISPEDLIKEIG